MKYIWPIATVVLVVLLLASMQTCSFHQGASNKNLDAVTDTVSYFQNRLGTETATIKSMQLTQKQLEKYVIEKDAELAALSKEFDRVKSIVKIETKTEIDTIEIAYRDSVPCIFERSGEIKDDWYSFAYQSNQKGLTIENFSVINKTTVITGFKRKWFLGKETVTTDVTNSSPYVKVTDLTAAEVVVPVPWYKKWYVWMVAGAVSGFVLSK